MSGFKSGMNVTLGVIVACFIVFIVLPCTFCAGVQVLTTAAVVNTDSDTVVDKSQAPSSSPKSPVSTKPKVEILEIDSKVTETNQIYAKYAYILRLRNHTDRPVKVTAEIKWLDATGFVVNSKREHSLVIPANDDKTFNGYDLIPFPSANDVAKVDVDLKRW
jgi:uncharacterized protein YcfL